MRSSSRTDHGAGSRRKLAHYGGLPRIPRSSVKVRAALAVRAAGAALVALAVSSCATGVEVRSRGNSRGSAGIGLPEAGADNSGAGGAGGATMTGSGGNAGTGPGGAPGTGGNAGTSGATMTGTGGNTGTGADARAPEDADAAGAAGLDAGTRPDAGPGTAVDAGGIVPSDAGRPVLRAFDYQPTNFDPSDIGAGASGNAVELDCGVSTFDSTTGAFDNWCGEPTPTPVTLTQTGGPDIVILPMADFKLSEGATLTLTGDHPVVLAVFGDATIAGTLDASADGTVPGAGGNQSCGGSQGADGDGDPARYSGASGGGGGGFGTEGGSSGDADTDHSDGLNPGASGGVVRGTPDLSPLLGGCAGGKAGGCDTAGGAGGGAVQVSAAGTLTISGSVLANGGDGSLPCGASDEGGGTGGGSGGGILLEASVVSNAGATIRAAGGDGGPDGDFFHCGGKSGGAGSTDPAQGGRDGTDCVAGSPGGGGGYGRTSVVNQN